MKYLNYFSEHKLPLGYTHFLIAGSMFLFFYIFLTSAAALSPSHNFKTSLNASDLLILAGLTITFYSLLLQVLEKVLIPFSDYVELSGALHGLIISNIMFVSLAIILILISTIGFTGLIKLGFIMLIYSWVYNFIIISEAFSAFPIKQISKNIIHKNLVDLVLTLIFIFLIYTLIGMYF